MRTVSSLSQTSLQINLILKSSVIFINRCRGMCIRRIERLYLRRNSFDILIAIALLAVTSRADICLNTISQNSNDNYCEFHYSLECNKTETLKFEYCVFNDCTDRSQKESCAAVTSTDLPSCSKICMKSTNLSQARTSWLVVAIIITSVLLISIVFLCIAHKCCKTLQLSSNHFIQQIDNRNQIETERRLNAENLQNFELRWIAVQPNQRWTNGSQQCVICLEEGPNSCLSCEHYFHSACLKEWLKSKSCCPTCRAERIRITLRCWECKSMKIDCNIQQMMLVDTEQKCSNCR